jgi:hypothetical protein
MRNLKPSNKNRIHMQDEGPAVRHKILAEFCNAPPFSEAHVYVASVTRRSERHARDDCFRSLTVDALELHAARIVIDTCGQDFADSKVSGFSGVVCSGGLWRGCRRRPFRTSAAGPMGRGIASRSARRRRLGWPSGVVVRAAR